MTPTLPGIGNQARTGSVLDISAITRWLALYRETGSVEARPGKAGRKPKLDEESLQKIAGRIKDVPDISLKERIPA
jgi:transposase